ncbi:MAG TPA: hypothetical protein VGX76_15980 [Pirellulales bacterium]|jgi:hypothetical protein|nr:hypothetical protein [Pirellulales bacterium]
MKFVLLDSSLADFSGHHYEYAQHVLDAASRAGNEPCLVANRRFEAERTRWPTDAAYKYGYWFHQGAPAWQRWVHAKVTSQRSLRFRKEASEHSFGQLGSVPRAALFRTARAAVAASRRRQFMRDTRSALGRLGAAEGDLIFAPSLSPEELISLERLLRMFPRCAAATWHLLLRRDVPVGRPLSRLRQCVRSLAGERHRPQVRFWTDSDDLTQAYQRATGCRFGTLPIPHACEAAARRAGGGPCQVVFLGDARREKGFHHLPWIVKAVTAAGGQGCRFAFRFQSHTSASVAEPVIDAARNDLMELADHDVTLIEQALEPAAYRRLLADSDVTLLPYEAAAYATRSSGVFADSLAAGVPVVVPAGTWMARQLSSGAGRVYRSLADVPAYVNDLATARLREADPHPAWAAAWRQQHNANRLLEMLAEST